MEAKEKKHFSKKICIEVKVDENGKRYFKIMDRGTGMDRYKIERYFTSIGRSFYSGEEYEDLNISYKPISNFGIGFLSSFMVCQEIDVKTKYYLNESEGLKLHIPNYDGCFFIELDKEANVGTELKLYLDNSVSDKNIVNYIQKVMQDIKYSIEICYLNERGDEIKTLIPAHAIRKKNDYGEFKFFIPFYENGEVGKIDYLNDILSNKYVEKYEYGLFIHKTEHLYVNNSSMVLNSGIAVQRTSLRKIFGENYRKVDYRYPTYEENSYNDIIANFPANWLQLDVARENVAGLSNVISDKNSERRPHILGIKIADSLCCQISQYIQYIADKKTEIPAIYLQDIIYYAIGFCGKKESEKKLREKLLKMKYQLIVEFSEIGLCYKLDRNGDIGERIKFVYVDQNSKKERNKWVNKLKKMEISHFLMEQVEYISDTEGPSRDMIRLFKEIIHRKDIYINDEIRFRIDHLIGDIPESLGIERNNIIIFRLLTILLLDMPDEMIICNSAKEILAIVLICETISLHYFCIGAENTQEINITYNELKDILKK